MENKNNINILVISSVYWKNDSLVNKVKNGQIRDVAIQDPSTSHICCYLPDLLLFLALIPHFHTPYPKLLYCMSLPISFRDI